VTENISNDEVVDEAVQEIIEEVVEETTTDAVEDIVSAESEIVVDPTPPGPVDLSLDEPLVLVEEDIEAHKEGPGGLAGKAGALFGKVRSTAGPALGKAKGVAGGVAGKAKDVAGGVAGKAKGLLKEDEDSQA
jgi:hypothetical protein